MKKLNPAHVTAIAKGANSCSFFSLLSMEVKSLYPGESLLQVNLQEKHLQLFGVAHGGVCASLIDTAIFWAVYADMEEVLGLTTVEIKLNYLSPVSRGLLIARGKSIKAGKTICLGEARVEDDKGTLVAHGTSTLMVLDSSKLKMEDYFQLPPKFTD